MAARGTNIPFGSGQAGTGQENYASQTMTHRQNTALGGSNTMAHTQATHTQNVAFGGGQSTPIRQPSPVRQGFSSFGGSTPESTTHQTQARGVNVPFGSEQTNPHSLLGRAQRSLSERSDSERSDSEASEHNTRNHHSQERSVRGRNINFGEGIQPKRETPQTNIFIRPNHTPSYSIRTPYIPSTTQEKTAAVFFCIIAILIITFLYIYIMPANTTIIAATSLPNLNPTCCLNFV